MPATRSRIRFSNFTVPTTPTLRPKLRRKPRISFSMAIAFPCAFRNAFTWRVSMQMIGNPAPASPSKSRPRPRGRAVQGSRQDPIESMMGERTVMQEALLESNRSMMVALVCFLVRHPGLGSVSELDQPHIRSPLGAAALRSRIRQARTQERRVHSSRWLF